MDPGSLWPTRWRSCGRLIRDSTASRYACVVGRWVSASPTKPLVAGVRASTTTPNRAPATAMDVVARVRPRREPQSALAAQAGAAAARSEAMRPTRQVAIPDIWKNTSSKPAIETAARAVAAILRSVGEILASPFTASSMTPPKRVPALRPVRLRLGDGRRRTGSRRLPKLVSSPPRANPTRRGERRSAELPLTFHDWTPNVLGHWRLGSLTSLDGFLPGSPGSPDDAGRLICPVAGPDAGLVTLRPVRPSRPAGRPGRARRRPPPRCRGRPWPRRVPCPARGSRRG